MDYQFTFNVAVTGTLFVFIATLIAVLGSVADNRKMIKAHQKHLDEFAIDVRRHMLDLRDAKEALAPPTAPVDFESEYLDSR